MDHCPLILFNLIRSCETKNFKTYSSIIFNLFHFSCKTEWCCNWISSARGFPFFKVPFLIEKYWLDTDEVVSCSRKRKLDCISVSAYFYKVFNILRTFRKTSFSNNSFALLSKFWCTQPREELRNIHLPFLFYLLFFRKIFVGFVPIFMLQWARITRWLLCFKQDDLGLSYSSVPEWKCQPMRKLVSYWWAVALRSLLLM